MSSHCTCHHGHTSTTHSCCVYLNILIFIFSAQWVILTIFAFVQMPRMLVALLIFASALWLRLVVGREDWAQLCVVVDLGTDRCSQGAPVCPEPGHKSPSLWLPRLAPNTTWYLRRPAPGDLSCLSPIQARQGPRFSTSEWLFGSFILILFCYSLKLIYVFLLYQLSYFQTERRQCCLIQADRKRRIKVVTAGWFPPTP